MDEENEKVDGAPLPYMSPINSDKGCAASVFGETDKSVFGGRDKPVFGESDKPVFGANNEAVFGETCSTPDEEKNAIKSRESAAGNDAVLYDFFPITPEPIWCSMGIRGIWKISRLCSSCDRWPSREGHAALIALNQVNRR
ncbi:hypothetical protein GEV33_014622 [Tenebrio molitor]|uniref:Uncharacterized protein n=1 Tax=Tenebrio molitor TaxID=7067 RepID=A0A8J6H575_TENMO|nr:hypothetical protein GEV33_014625 [Tenebrio molitor]KAH0808169.1 hypothetical protein GEV33_014622 [Tenebrio molitor]